MLDIDHFKVINDTYGHLTGDAVLREVTQRISKAVRSYDSVGRYGGEEFVIVLPGCSRDQVDQGAERVRAAVDNGPVWVNESQVPVTVSIGAAVTTHAGISEKEILAAADAALYQAKENRTKSNGGIGFRFYLSTPEPHTRCWRNRRASRRY